MGRSRFDQNNITSLIGVSSSDGSTPVELWVDPTTHALVVAATATLAKDNIPASGLTQAVSVQIVDGSGNQITSFGGGTQYTNGGVPPANPVGPTLLFNNAGAWATVSAATPLPVTGSLTVGGTTDNSAFTAGTTTGTPAMGFYHSTIDTVTDGRSAAFGMTSKRAMLVNLQTAAGVELTNTGSALDINLKTSSITLGVSNAALTTADLDTGAGTDTRGVAGIALSKSGGALILASGQQAMASSLPVAIASDQASFPVTIAAGSAVIGHVITDANSVTNATLTAETTKVIGVTRTADGAGNLLTSNSTTFTAKFGLDINLLGTLGTAFSTAGKVDVKGADGDVFVRQTAGSNLNANVTLQTQTDTVMVGGVNIKEINAITPLMGNGATGTGSLRATISNDNTAIANWGQGATGAAVPSGAQYQGFLAQTALPSAATAGNLTGALSDKYGRPVVLPGTIRDLVGTQTTTISASTSETTIVTAAASVFNDLTALLISNTSATATRLDFRDTTAGSVLFSVYVPAGDIRGVAFSRPVPQTTVNTNWTATSSVSITDLRIYAVWDKNK